MKLIKMLLKMKKHLSCVVSKGFFFLIIIIIVLIIRTLLLPESWGFNHDVDDGVELVLSRSVKYLEVPQIVWGLNNQKIGFARACLTARFLNRTLLMPSLSATLFYKEINQLQPISFDKVFRFDEFNSLCKGFVQLGRYSDLQNHSNILVVQKGSGRRWTVERDLDQLKELKKKKKNHETIQLVGKNPFLWHDHFPVKDYAKVFECLVLIEEISKEADKVVGKIRDHHHHHLGSKNGYYVAVHMRIEKDWMIHCKKLQQRLNVSDICSSKQEMMSRVANIQGLKTPTVVYLAVAADALVEEDDGLMMNLNGWKEVGLVAVEKKRLGVVEIYKKHPYLIQAAIDYEVCSRADVFVGNSYSTFSSLLVLQRSVRYWPCFAYNLKAMEGSAGARPWRTSLSGSSLQAISYGTNNISC